MENERLSQGVKILRKEKGLSQTALANKSGLSLRTIQRLENGETEPSGETLKRISTVLDISPKELIEWNSHKETLKNSIKTKNEYIHIFENKLIFSKTPEIPDLVEDYAKSVNHVFKSLMVFFVFIPIFTTLAVIFIHIEKLGLAIYAGSMAFFFLTIAFYYMLFTSGSSMIRMENINKITIRKPLYNTVLEILHKESGRLKKRHIILEEKEVNRIRDLLLSEKLIEKAGISVKKNKKNRILIIGFFALLFIIPNFLLPLINGNKNIRYTMMYYGFYMLIISVILIAIMIIRSLKQLIR